MTEYNPPPFVERIQYQSAKQINDPVTRKRVYQTPDGEKLPSVTTILSKTKDQTHLIEWRKRVGEAKAQQITTEAAGVGTAMHANLERFLIGEQRQPGNNPVHVQANKMANVIIENGLSKMDEVWAMEQSLYFPGLYSGTTDLVGVYNGNPAICDHKQTNKPKKEEWVEDYYLQLVAYALAHNEVYGTDIKHGHIFMCSRAFEYQQFNLTPDNWNKYHDMWLERVEQYYGLT
jgi:ATP-dependent exoDNAse (exonuclease V) beta subunit